MKESDLPFLPTVPSHTAPDDAPALFDDTSPAWVNYGELRARIRALMPLFGGQGRELVFCCIPSSIEGVTAYLGAAAAGHAVAHIDPALPHLAECVAAYEPKWIVVPAGRDFPGYGMEAAPFSTLQVWRREKAQAQALHPDLYLMLLTSGSTGGGKGVRLSYKNIASNTRAIIESLDLTFAARAIIPLPLSYSFGLSVLHTQLAVGGSCILTARGFMQREFWQLAEAQQASLVPGVPYHYEMLARLAPGPQKAPSLTTFLQAGGAMTADLTQKILNLAQERGGKLFIMYGQTEAAPRISCFPLHRFPEKIGSCGRVLAGGKVTVEEGQIIYSGPNVMMGYATGRADLARGDEMNGRLPTGDIGRLDEEGFLYITGRAQRFAKLYGNRIALDDLERVMRATAQVVAMELPDRIVLVVTGQNPAACESIKARACAETGLPPAWLEVRSIDAVPRLTSGKVDYRALREIL